jgi:hypothetical protein
MNIFQRTGDVFRNCEQDVSQGFLHSIMMPMIAAESTNDPEHRAVAVSRPALRNAVTQRFS